MRNYDFVFSLGSSCGVTQALRAAGLQFASYPFDWTATPRLAAAVGMLERDFAGWIEADDLKLWDVRHGTGFCTRCYLNTKTMFGFSHEFSDFERFETSYPRVREMYVRRCGRLLEQLRSARRILGVYCELPIRRQISRDALADAVRRLRAKFPQGSFDLLYFCEDPTCAAPVAEEALDGVTVVRCDYRLLENGRVVPFIDNSPMTGYLRANVCADRKEADADERRFATDMKKIATLRWGKDKGVLRRWCNRHLYQLYRHLEGLLRKRGVIHPEPPLWFGYEEMVAQEGE